MIRLQQVAKHCVPELGFEPGALGRHNAAGIDDLHEIVDARRMHGKGAGVFAAVDEFLQFAGASDTADKVEPGTGAWIGDAKNWIEHVFLQQGHIEFLDWISRSSEARAKIERV